MNPTYLLKPICALGLMLSISACQPKPLTEQEQRTVTQLTANMKTQCVGRYLIDLPADVDIYGHAKLSDVDVKIEPMSQQAFLDGMHKRETELKAMKHIDGYQFLFGDNEYRPMNSSTEQMRKEGIWHFIHLGAIDAADTRRVLEAYKWNKGYRIKLQARTWDYTHSDSSNAKEMGNRVPSRLGDMMSLLHDFRGLSDGEIPKEPGICLTGGFIKSEASAEEEVSMSFYLRDKRDVSFDLETRSNIREKNTLLQRGHQIEETYAERNGHTVRKGKVDLPELTSTEEWLAAGITDSKVRGHHFTLEANSMNSNAKTPLFMLDMDNGAFPQDVPTDKIIKASLTEGEAVALWDAVSRTVRVRPGAMDAMPLPPVARSKLSVPAVISGQLCPENGYWTGYCDGKRFHRLFFKGDVMPAVEVMQAVPYRWLPTRINAWLEQRERLPMVKAEREARWHLESFLSS